MPGIILRGSKLKGLLILFIKSRFIVFCCGPGIFYGCNEGIKHLHYQVLLIESSSQEVLILEEKKIIF